MYKEIQEKFAYRLKKLLEEKGKSQGWLALYLGISKENVTYWTHKRNMPRYDTLVKIADILEVSTDYLLGRTEE